MGKFSTILRAMRLEEWMDTLLIINISCIISLFFIGLSSEIAIKYIIFILYVFSLLMYGFSLNSYADKKEDASVGKNAEFIKLSKISALFLIFLSGTLTLTIPLAFGKIYLAIYNLLIFAITTAYSLKPIRLKERGLIGVLGSSLIRGALPFIIFAKVVNVPWALWIYLAIWMFLSEFIGDLIHHIDDFQNDERTNTKTWVQVIGLSKAKNILKYVLLIYFLYAWIALFIFNIWNGIFIAILITILNSQIYLEDLINSFL